MQRFQVKVSDMELEEEILQVLKTVYDPEIPVNIYDLGLIYDIDIDEDARVVVSMTLTAPACPLADFIVDEVRMKLESIAGITAVEVRLVFEPAWTVDRMSEEARLELGFM